MTIGPEAARGTCIKLFAQNQRMFHWPAMARMKLQFAHQQTYPDWIASIVNANTFPALKQAKQKLLVAVSRPSKLLRKHGSIGAATLAYIVDKKIVHSIHPRLPRYLSLKQQFYDLQDCNSAKAAQELLNAAAARHRSPTRCCLMGNGRSTAVTRTMPLCPARWTGSMPARWC